MTRAAIIDEVEDLRREPGALQEVVVELTLKVRCKKNVTGGGRNLACDIRHPRNWRSSAWLRWHLPPRHTLDKLGVTLPLCYR
jgi:hypothetical protein